ncbi:MAG: cytochrome-c peroxidase [Bacteroidetes bacterium]|nr:MAG: cytochrome-c peroxidase [Bacteroidota bacterium]
MKNLKLLSALFLMLAFLTSCLEDREELTVLNYTDEEFATLAATLDLPSTRDSYGVEFPDHLSRRGVFPPFVNDAKATLGRVLFYDKHLSKNNTISCASCHKQDHAFADDKAFSEGFDGGQTARNSLSLAAVVNFPTYYGGGATFVRPRFMWDERAETVLEQSTMAIEDDIEMGMQMHELSAKLGELDYYQVLFKKAYGDSYVSQERILDAIQEFINSFVSADSKFDSGLNMVNDASMTFSNYTDAENRGKQLYMQNCATCHSTDLSIPVERYANNGLDSDNADPGVGGINGISDDIGKFKVPPLRNIEFSAPYMHDGRFATLEDVLDHYSQNIQNNPNLDARLRNGSQPIQMNFTEQDKQDMIAFMKTLTDNTLLQAERFSDPFK